MKAHPVPTGNNQPLRIEVVGGCIVISIGVETLKYCHNELEKEADEGFINGTGFMITDAHRFAVDVVAALLHEEEDGTTPVHKLLDMAIKSADEDGSIYTKESKAT